LVAKKENARRFEFGEGGSPNEKKREPRDKKLSGIAGQRNGTFPAATPSTWSFGDPRDQGVDPRKGSKPNMRLVSAERDVGGAFKLKVTGRTVPKGKGEEGPASPI